MARLHGTRAALAEDEGQHAVDPLLPLVDEQQAAMIASLQQAGDGTNLVEVFAADAPARLSEILQALDDGDCVAAARGAHNLRGGAAMFGLPRVAAITSRLEQEALAGRADALMPLFEELTAAVSEGVAALAAWVPTRRPARTPDEPRAPRG